MHSAAAGRSGTCVRCGGKIVVPDVSEFQFRSTTTDSTAITTDDRQKTSQATDGSSEVHWQPDSPRVDPHTDNSTESDL